MDEPNPLDYAAVPPPRRKIPCRLWIGVILCSISPTCCFTGFLFHGDIDNNPTTPTPPWKETALAIGLVLTFLLGIAGLIAIATSRPNRGADD